MASIKIKLKSISKSNDLYPVVLQIIKNRKRKIITTGLECPKNLWDEKIGCYKSRHANSRNNNQLLDTLKIRARNVISEFEMEEMDFSLDEFEMKFRIGSTSTKMELFPFWQSIIDDMIASGRMGNARANKDTMRSFKRFVGRDGFVIRQVDATCLEKYEVFLRSSGGTSGGVGVKMRALRAIYNTAIRRGLVKSSYYPFKAYKVSRLKGRGMKEALTFNEIQRLKTVDCLSDTNLVNAKNYFVFSFYTRGMNFADMMLLKWSDINDNRIKYVRVKTQGKFSVKITEPLKEILDYYRLNGNDTRFVFPILLRDVLTPQQIENRKHKILSQYNSDLKIIAVKAGISKNITSYVARHSYAMCLREKGIGIDLIGESLGHQNIATTKAYVRDFGVDLIDEAVDVLI